MTGVVSRFVFGLLLSSMVLGCASQPPYTEQGAALLKQRKYAAAIQSYQEAIAEDPELAGAFRGLGIAYFLNDQLDLAEQALTRSRELQDSVHAITVLARLYQVKLRYEDGAKLLNEAIAMSPESDALQLQLAELQLEAGDNTSAVESFHVALSLNPDLADAFVGLALALKNQDRYAEAVDMLNEGRERIRGRALARIYISLGRIYEAMDRLDVADRSYLKAMVINPKSAEAIAGHARALRLGAQYVEAIELLKKALRDHPRNGILHLELGLAYNEYRLPKQAIEALREAVARDQSLVDAYAPLIELITKAKTGGDELYAVLAKAAAAIPLDTAIQLRYADAAYRRRDDTAVLATVKRVIEREPANAEANYYLGRSQMRLGDRDGAIETYEALTHLDPVKADKLRQVIEGDNQKKAAGKKKRKKKKGGRKKKRRR